MLFSSNLYLQRFKWQRRINFFTNKYTVPLCIDQQNLVVATSVTVSPATTSTVIFARREKPRMKEPFERRGRLWNRINCKAAPRNPFAFFLHLSLEGEHSRALPAAGLWARRGCRRQQNILPQPDKVNVMYLAKENLAYLLTWCNKAFQSYQRPFPSRKGGSPPPTSMPRRGAATLLCGSRGCNKRWQVKKGTFY